MELKNYINGLDCKKLTTLDDIYNFINADKRKRFLQAMAKNIIPKYLRKFTRKKCRKFLGLGFIIIDNLLLLPFIPLIFLIIFPNCCDESRLPYILYFILYFILYAFIIKKIISANIEKKIANEKTFLSTFNFLNDDETKEIKSIILNEMLTFSEYIKLGNVFAENKNQVTDKMKTTYLGEIFFEIQNNEYVDLLFCDEKETICNKKINIDDIAVFKTIVADDRYSLNSELKKDIDRYNELQRLESEYAIRDALNNATKNHSLIDDYRYFSIKSEKREVENKLEEEKQNKKDKIFVKILRLKDENIILIDHINSIAEKKLEDLIEKFLSDH